jgi:hypothetical protein
MSRCCAFTQTFTENRSLSERNRRTRGQSLIASGRVPKMHRMCVKYEYSLAREALAVPNG